MSKVISATVVNPNGKEDTCAYAVVDSKELYYLLSPVATLDNYTISFFIKAHANETLKIWYGEEYKEFEVTTSWQKVTWNFTAEWIDNLMLQFTEGNYYIYNTMLERGNVATDYSPSQYDQEKMLKDIEDALNTKYAQISITLDNIALEVNETSSKLGNVESSVKLMSDEINLKVNKNGVIGAINLSSEQAQIKASKIDLVGAVTISSLSSDVTAKFDTLDSITVTDNNLTYIDGAKIYTGSITADKIDVDDLFAQDITATGTITGATLKGTDAEITKGKIGSFTLTDKLAATVNAYVAPSSTERDKVKNYVYNSGTLTSTELSASDLNKDGSVTIKDLLLMNKILFGDASYSAQSGAKLTSVSMEINPTNAEKLIRLTGTNAWGRSIEQYFGINGLKTDNVIAKSVVANSVETLSGANLDTINSNLNTINIILNQNGVNVKQCGKHVEVSIYNTNGKTFTANKWNTLATLPVGSRPSGTVRFTMDNNLTAKQANSTAVMGKIDATGTICIWAFDDNVTLAPCGSCSFFAEN